MNRAEAIIKGVVSTLRKHLRAWGNDAASEVLTEARLLLVENYFQTPSWAWVQPWPSRISGRVPFGRVLETRVCIKYWLKLGPTNREKGWKEEIAGWVHGHAGQSISVFSKQTIYFSLSWHSNLSTLILFFTIKNTIFILISLPSTLFGN